MRKLRVLLLVLSILLLLCACAKEQATAAQVLDALVAAEIGLRAGQIYLSAVPEDDASYLSPDLVAALY